MSPNKISRRLSLRDGKTKSAEDASPAKSSMLATFVVPITLAILTLLGTVVGGLINSYKDRELVSMNSLKDRAMAQQKFESDLVLKALESGSPQERLESLRLLTKTNLIKDPDVRQGVEGYVTTNQNNPEAIPQIKSDSPQTISAPVVGNARVYLLSGKKADAEVLTDFKNQLIAAKYTVLGAKYLEDKERPETPEIRYFNQADKQQAENIAEYMRLKYPNIPAKLYSDDSAKPGYVEIWLGR